VALRAQNNWLRRAWLIAGLAGSLSSLACGSNDDAPGRTDSGGDSSNAAPHFPCDVEDVIEAKCQRCHDRPPQNGAPFSLLTWQDTRAQYGLQLVYQAMLPAIETDFMPLTQLPLVPQVLPLSPHEKTLLLDWLGDGAPPAIDGNCD
jgi:hypothetical protein